MSNPTDPMALSPDLRQEVDTETDKQFLTDAEKFQQEINTLEANQPVPTPIPVDPIPVPEPPTPAPIPDPVTPTPDPTSSVPDPSNPGTSGSTGGDGGTGADSGSGSGVPPTPTDPGTPSPVPTPDPTPAPVPSDPAGSPAGSVDLAAWAQVVSAAAALGITLDADPAVYQETATSGGEIQMTYNGPSDTLTLPGMATINKGDTFSLPEHALVFVEQLKNEGHQFADATPSASTTPPTA